jgi:plasmid stabilization system protein ParE
MRTSVLWTPQAREDLLDIYVTIGFDNPSAAERMWRCLQARPVSAFAGLKLRPQCEFWWKACT